MGFLKELVHTAREVRFCQEFSIHSFKLQSKESPSVWDISWWCL